MTDRRFIALAAAAVLVALAAGIAIGHLRVPAAVVASLRQAIGSEQAYLSPPDAAAAEYRRQRVALFRASPARAPQVVMLGDSHTEGGPWSELLPGVTVLNRGLGWDTTDDVLARLDEVIARKPQAVFLLVGIVDLRYGADPDAVADKVLAIAARLEAAGIRPVVQSVLPVSPTLREPTNDKVRRVNDRLRTSPHFLDLHPALVKDGALDPALTWDGVHLSGPAYLSWARLLRESGF